MFDVLGVFWRHRRLVLRMTRREVVGRYQGSLLGVGWSVVHPVVMLAVYTFTFGVVFRAKWGGGGPDAGPAAEGRLGFATVLFCGLIVFNFFSECVSRAPTLVLAQPSYVKRVVFPLEILPWVASLGALFHAATSLLVLLALVVASGALPPWTVVFLPVVLFPLLLVTLGVSWFLASFGVFVRDVGQLVGAAVSVLLFMSPVFYPVSAVPDSVRPLLLLNPVTLFVEEARGVTLWGRPPDWTRLAAALLVGSVTASAGLWWFGKTKRGFADVV